ncbi:hypothetical protein [Pseudomonas silesiensis]|uniref:hypothetical protein n=1 Tax=Pseudomonas silesiensis TaxID=1853130 RepID=UPI0030DAC844
MHRIDVPSATVDHLFTEGSPTAGVPATIVTADWMNDVQEEVMSVLEAAGIAPVKGTQDQLLKAIRAISVGAIGTASHVKMSVSAASASATLTAYEIVVGATLGGQVYKLSGLNKTINLASTGAGGMDAGTAPVSGYVAVYAIYNPDSGASALLATNATSAAQPETYSGANMPAGYTASALLTVVATNASSQFLPVYVSGRDVFIGLTQIYSSATQQATLTLRDVSLAIPPNAKTADISTIVASSSSGVTIQSAIAGSNAAAGGLGQKINGATSASAGAGLQSQFPNIPIITPQTIYYSVTIGSGTLSFSISIGGYSI